MPNRRSLSLSPLLLLVAACGNPAATNPDLLADSDGGTVGDGAGAPADLPPLVLRTGEISIAHRGTATVASAIFVKVTDAKVVETTSGPCLLTGGFKGSAITTEGAGTVTVSGGLQDFTMTSMNNVYTYMDSSAPWDGSQTITVDATGAAVPAFSSVQHVPTTAASVSAPAPDGSDAYVADRAADLTFTWSGGTAGDLVLIQLTSPMSLTLQCAFDASLGSGTIPKATLATLAAGAGTFNVWSARQETKMAGGYLVKIKLLWQASSTVSTSGVASGVLTVK